MLLQRYKLDLWVTTTAYCIQPALLLPEDFSHCSSRKRFDKVHKTPVCDDDSAPSNERNFGGSSGATKLQRPTISRLCRASRLPPLLVVRSPHPEVFLGLPNGPPQQRPLESDLSSRSLDPGTVQAWLTQLSRFIPENCPSSSLFSLGFALE